MGNIRSTDLTGSRIKCLDVEDFKLMAVGLLNDGYKIGAYINEGKYVVKILGHKEVADEKKKQSC